MSFLSKALTSLKRKPSNPTPLPQFPSTLLPYTTSTLFKGAIHKIIQLPPHMPRPDWIVTNLYQFFHNLSLIFSTIPLSATTASPFQDKRKVSESAFVDSTLQSIHLLLETSSFPTRVDQQFEGGWQDKCKILCRDIQALFGIVFGGYENVLHLGLEVHVNTLWIHFYGFVNEFQLMSDAEIEANGLEELVKYLKEQGVV